MVSRRNILLRRQERPHLDRKHHLHVQSTRRPHRTLSHMRKRGLNPMHSPSRSLVASRSRRSPRSISIEVFGGQEARLILLRGLYAN